MTTPTNLMGLGVPPFVAKRLGMHVEAVTCAGATAGAARQIQAAPGIYYVNASNSGSGVALPVAGTNDNLAPLLGDEYIIANIVGATIYVYANNNGAGSAVILYGRGLSAAGTTGVSIATGVVGRFEPITSSTWVFMASV